MKRWHEEHPGASRKSLLQATIHEERAKRVSETWEKRKAEGKLAGRPKGSKNKGPRPDEGIKRGPQKHRHKAREVEAN
jgi:hypothetical protein